MSPRGSGFRRQAGAETHKRPYWEKQDSPPVMLNEACAFAHVRARIPTASPVSVSGGSSLPVFYATSSLIFYTPDVFCLFTPTPRPDFAQMGWKLNRAARKSLHFPALGSSIKLSLLPVRDAAAQMEYVRSGEGGQSQRGWLVGGHLNKNSFSCGVPREGSRRPRVGLKARPVVNRGGNKNATAAFTHRFKLY